MKASKRVQWGSIPVTLDRLSLSDRLFVGTSLIATLLMSFPYITHAQVRDQVPFVIEINNTTSLPKYLATGVLEPETDLTVLQKILPLSESTNPDPRVPILEEYLKSKNSPLAPYADVLLEQYHYRLILGISFAESNFCKVQIQPHNCWGIGGTNAERYATYADGIVRANQLIQRYQDNGMKNPRLMHNTWVGWDNNRWILAVEQITEDLESRGL